MKETSAYSEFFQKYLRQEAQSEQMLTTEQQRVLQEFNREILAATPATGWGEVSIRAASSHFRKTFSEHLEQHFVAGHGSVDEHVAQHLETDGFSKIYTVKSQEPATLSKAEQVIWRNHQQESVQGSIAALTALQNSLDDRLKDVPTFIQAEYRAMISKELKYCELVDMIGTEQFSRQHIEPAAWHNLLDAQALENGDIRLRYESDAEYVLRLNQQSIERSADTSAPPEQYGSVLQALEYWHLSAEEMNSLGLTDAELAGQQITVEQLQSLFNILFSRSEHLSAWVAEINESKAVMDVNAKARKIELPPNKTYGPDQIVFLPSHELVHIIGGENGDKQAVGTLRTGMDDYLPTEEGKAVLAELIAGQKFGHSRQVKMAARYYAVALAMKTEQSPDGSLQVKHSIQDIYNILRKYQVNAKDAQEIVWRIMRGTSLQRKLVEIPVDSDTTVVIGEVYPKDAVYFEGQLKIFEEFLKALPLNEADRARLEQIHARDMSNKLLARVGRQAFLGEKQPTANDSLVNRKVIYEELVKLGKDTLFDLLQHSLVGKINWDTINHNQDWEKLFVRDTTKLVQFKDIVYGTKTSVDTSFEK